MLYIGVWLLAGFLSNVVSTIVTLALNETEFSFVASVNSASWAAALVFCSIYLPFKSNNLSKVFPWALLAAAAGFAYMAYTLNTIGPWVREDEITLIFINTLLVSSAIPAFFYIKGEKMKLEVANVHQNSDQPNRDEFIDPAYKYIPKPKKQTLKNGNVASKKVMRDDIAGRYNPNKKETKLKDSSLSSEPINKEDELEISEDISLVLEYSLPAKKGWDQLKDLPDDIKAKFLTAIENNPKQDFIKVAHSLASEYETSQAPYEKSELNEALAEARKLGPDAEREFIRVIDILGEELTVEDVLCRIEDKFSGLKN
jgi:hypothetical protein